jgi:hypothetical protein
MGAEGTRTEEEECEGTGVGRSGAEGTSTLLEDEGVGLMLGVPTEKNVS